MFHIKVLKHKTIFMVFKLSAMKYFCILFYLLISHSYAQQILSEKDRALVVDEILAERFNVLLPKLMDRAEIDMWVLISRENNEDPVLRTMLPATWLNARRRTIILFYRDKTKNTIEKLAVARYNFGEHIISAWNKDEGVDQWTRLIQMIDERNPDKIALNYSKDFNIADGLDKTDYEEFMSHLPDNLKPKVVSSEKLAIAWIETRTTSRAYTK